MTHYKFIYFAFDSGNIVYGAAGGIFLWSQSLMIIFFPLVDHYAFVCQPLSKTHGSILAS